MGQGSNFSGRSFVGQPVLGQILNLLDKKAVQSIAKSYCSDRYTKKLDTASHLYSLLFGIISGCASLRELTLSMLSDADRMPHIGICFKLSRSTLADANRRRSEKVFGSIYMSLYEKYRRFLSDSRLFKGCNRNAFAIDSTTVTLFSEVLRGTCKPNARLGCRKGGAKVHAVMNVEEGVPCLIRISKAAKADTKYMHLIRMLPAGSIVAMDRGYGDHGQYEKISRMGIWYVTRLKDIVKYDAVRLNSQSESEFGVQRDELVSLSLPDSRERHEARRIVYTGKVISKGKEISKTFVFLTNNVEMDAETIAQIYRSRWQIELLFKRIKQSFPLKYFYGDSKNAIKTQIWAVMIACLLLTVVHRRASAGRVWAFSNMLKAIKCLMMKYIDIYLFLENPDKKWEDMLKRQQAPPRTEDLFSISKNK
jgi:hypothetical protein